MTNKPMLSVERELRGAVEQALLAIKRIYQAGHDGIVSAGGSCDQPGMMFEGDPTVRELRALLDKAVLESQYEGMTQEQAQAVSDGVDEILHGEPAAHKQPAPVYQVCDGVNGWIDVDLLRYTGCCLDPEEYECRVLYAEQSAPTQHTMWTVMEAVGVSKVYTVLTSNQCRALAEALNGVKP